MTYKSLCRKYRPIRFEDVCGQDFIVKTLNNAIFKGKINHAYLFCGTRGTGKTTIAKIFAKAINCMNPINNLPCGKCEICLNDNTDKIPDIIEIDAASNNGVDEIRELKNKVRLVPTMCKYKVYIIDEVHMLSVGAFNALLKTLEEPPAHVIFILATTEPQKLPITILSRCQRFDFRNISTENIVERLKFISEKEGIEIEDDALIEIAKMSDGALRDAISTLDQVSSYADNKITVDDIYAVKGSLSKAKLFELINNFLNDDKQFVLNNIDEIYNMNKNFMLLAKDLLYVFRNMLVYKKAPKYFDNKYLSSKEEIIAFASKLEEKEIENIIKQLEKVLLDLKYSDYPRVLFEIFCLTSYKESNSNLTITKTPETQKIVQKSKNNVNNIEKSPKIIKKIEKNDKNNEKMDLIEEKTDNQLQISDSKQTMDKKVLVNNTIALATTKDKKAITAILDDIEKYLVDTNYMDVATILQDATVAAASKDHVLFVYKYASIVDSFDDALEKIRQFISDSLNKDYKIVALTEDEWKEQRPYYISLKKEKGKIELLEEIDYNNVVTNLETENNEIENLFGTDLIEMEG